jgi:hypothetical protein
MQKLLKIFMLLSALLIIFGCAPIYNAQADMYTVYGTAKVDIPSGFKNIGGLSVTVIPNSWESGNYPYQRFNTTVFGDGESYILSQTMQVSGNRYYVRPLTGSNVSKWGTGWRMNTYQLDPNNTGAEYARYMEYIKGTGNPLASNYRMEMYDKLIGRKLVARVLVLTPDTISGYAAAPLARDLYTLDRDDFRSR